MEELKELKDMKSMMQMYLDQMEQLQKDIQNSYKLITKQKSEINDLKVEYKNYRDNLEYKIREELESQKKEISLTECLRYFAINKNAQYSQYMMQQYIKYRNYVRLDIINEGSNDNELELIVLQSEGASEKKANWNSAGIWHILEGYSGSLHVKYRSVREGKIKIRIRGIDTKLENIRLPIWVKLLKLEINGKVIFDKARLVWYDDFWGSIIESKDGDILDIVLNWETID